MKGLNVVSSAFLWIALAFCLTGPDPQERLGVAAGVNCSGRFDADGDGDLDLVDVAEFLNGISQI